MNRTILLLSLSLLWSSAVWAGAEPAASADATVRAESAQEAGALPAPNASDLWSAIFGVPSPQPAASFTCTAETRCSNGLWLGCYGYTGPEACESYRNCVWCDGKLYRCPSGFCPL
jgi:hypothetical protein